MALAGGVISCGGDPSPVASAPACTADATVPVHSVDGLASLAPCEAVTGMLVLTELSHVELPRLHTMSGTLQVASASPLENLAGLGGLTTVEEHLFVGGNPSLVSLDGLEKPVGSGALC